MLKLEIKLDDNKIFLWKWQLKGLWCIWWNYYFIKRETLVYGLCNPMDMV